MKTCIFLLAALSLMIGFGLHSALSADEETLSRQVEEAGNYREALNYYVSALQKTPEGSSKDSELREKIIKLSQKIQPPPALTEDAKRHMARGQGAIKAAKSQEDWADAVKEYEKAVYFAPWYADAYYNLGVARDKAGQFDGAIWALKMYLLVKPYAEDAEQVKNLMYEIEYRQEKTQKEAKHKVEDKAKAETSPESLSGKWKGSYLSLSTVLYNRPNISSDWIKTNNYTEVSVIGNNFEAIMMVRDKPWYRFKGIIYGNKISGTFYDVSGYVEQSCGSNPSSPLEGEISQDRNTILLIVRGIQWLQGGNCKYDPEIYNKSIKLER